MNTKHTPGPWGFAGEPHGYIVGSTASEDKRYIARVCGDVPTVQEEEANARLIAAAPELLDVCGELIRVIDALKEENVLGDWPVVRESIRPIRAAIAKATGQD